MTTARFPTREHWYRMKVLMSLFVVTKLLHFSLGQTLCGYNTVCNCTANIMCPSGFCCRSSDNTCGETTDYCGAKSCGSQCATACGPNNYGALCPDGQCCNILGFCGNTSRYCGVEGCASQCAFSTDECGSSNDEPCFPGACCSSHDYCGVDSAYCGAGNCSSQCPTGACGFNNGDLPCSNGDCCNIYGFCGNTSGHCAPGYCLSQCLRLSSTPAPTTPGGLVPGPGKSGGKNLGLIIAVSAMGPLLVLVLVAGIINMAKLRSRRRWTALGKDPATELVPKRFTYQQLKRAAKGFNRRLGKGGSGSVYFGDLGEGVEVAVKKIKSDADKAAKEFAAEVSTISQLRHRSLIQLHGWCEVRQRSLIQLPRWDEAKEDKPEVRYLLVYPFMPNGSLDRVLFEKEIERKEHGEEQGEQQEEEACWEWGFLTKRRDEKQVEEQREEENMLLPWPTRFEIIKDIAAAVNYLHTGVAKKKVIHRDIKPANIMLTDDWKAVLGDFGLARLVDRGDNEHTTLYAAGTCGYMAPELLTNLGIFTEKGDVYAFGVVVLEIVCGQRTHGTSLHEWVLLRLRAGELLSTVDHRLEHNEEQMELALNVGLSCCNDDPADRPDMLEVVAALGKVGSLPRIVAPPGALTLPSSYERVDSNWSRHSISKSRAEIQLARIQS